MSHSRRHVWLLLLRLWRCLYHDYVYVAFVVTVHDTQLICDNADPEM